MSRVDEALNRAGGGDQTVTGLTRAAGGALMGEQSLDDSIADYPHERERVERLRPVGKDRADRVASQAPRLTSHPAPTFHFDRSIEGKVVVDREASPVSVEQYRRLAATFHGLQVNSDLRTVLVSSALPRDGKTLTTTNLALTLSESYKRRVLVIDADLRRPSLHSVFGLENEIGLADGLRSAEGHVSVFQVSSTLAVLPAGTPDRSPMAGLTSDRMAAILKAASTQFDWILLDSPPIGLISDARLLADLVDGVLLVVGAGSTDHAAISKTVQELGRERIVGVVLNRVRTEVSSAGHYDDYYLPAGAEQTGPKP
jgi:capsular exopolysaccharide synthesis family protein